MQLTSLFLSLLPIVSVLSTPLLGSHISHSTQTTSYTAHSTTAPDELSVSHKAPGFDAAVTKGKTILSNMQTKIGTGTDRTTPLSLTSFSQIPSDPQLGPSKAQPAPPALQAALKSFLGIDGTTKSFFRLKLTAGGRMLSTVTASDNMYSPSLGLAILMKTEPEPGKPDPSKDPEPSEVVIQQYAKLCSNTKVVGSGHSLSTMKGLAIFEITNKDTIRVINELYFEAKKNRAQDDLIFNKGSEGLEALIGNSNGEVGASMLGDYPKEMKMEGIESVMLVRGQVKNSLILKFE